MTSNRRLKSYFQNLLIYLLITVVPSLTISYMYDQHEVTKMRNQYINRAQEYANFHAMNLENFFGETVGRLEMLATSIKIQYNDVETAETLLRETVRKDSRFSGFYLTNVEGDLSISTNPMTSVVNVSDREYFQQAVTTLKTSISDPHIGRVTGRHIITVATPIVENGQIKGVLLASLRIDEIEAVVKSLVKNEAIVVRDRTDTTLIEAGALGAHENSVTAWMRVAQVPWTVTSSLAYEDGPVLGKPFLKALLILLTSTNVFFLLFKYFLLKKRLVKEQEQTEIHKLELIGNLAASTAHEIRNPLTGIKGLVKLLSEEYHDKKAQSYFEVIQQEIDRINVIVSELLVLGKPTAYTLKSYNANEIVKEIEPIIFSEANFTNVQLAVDYAPCELPISCVKDHLKQVILNLAKNSLQAMPRGGNLSISLEKQANACVIIVEDNGVGMLNEQVNQAFNPFYTLKKDGSGLGLTVCKRIIETYGGIILLESAPQKGTKVAITLPLNDY